MLFFRLAPKELWYDGPDEIGEYDIIGQRMCIKDGQTEIITVEFLLGRNLLGKSRREQQYLWNELLELIGNDYISEFL